MFKGILGRVVGDSNDREIRKLQPLVDAINAREPEMERHNNAELRSMTDQFRSRLAEGEPLDDLLPEAFAVARETAKRAVALRPFDVQLIGGIVLHQGKVAEMRTGEGKTLVATLPIYLNALGGQGVHLVTVNDYLARRDTLWMGPIYSALGLNVGLLQSGMEQPAYLYDPNYQREPYPGLRPVPRAEAYAAEITYGTNNEFGFDYLRDNLALALSDRVQRPLHYGIVDEVDNIFIDEARTPLIISGRSGEQLEDYRRFAAIARQLQPDVHYDLDEKERSVFLTDEGLAVVERETGIENIYDEANYRYVHFMEQALKAQVLFQEGRDYIRQRKRIVLVDPHTGRLMPDRRLSEGLHQAIEAKEGVEILPRDVTSATITIQNYFRMYKKLAGMSGTAVTESEEFFKIYSLDVLSIPTNKPMIRADNPDVVYRTEEAKLRAVAREILACHSRGQPVLVGTTSVEMSERLSQRLSGERLQMAATAPLLARAMQDADLEKEERARMRQTMDANLETMNSAAWRKLARDLGFDASAVSTENMERIVEYLELPDGEEAGRVLEQALRDGIPHQVLNAKEHTREAGIIARAGEPGAVTIATNMAGRGVDIRLGGELTAEVIGRAHQALRARGLDPFKATTAQFNSAVAEVAPQYAKRRDQVLAADGLHILGTERHEARRIDNQLRGRSGRQGEPGSSRFYLSLEDELMRRFGRKEMLSRLMEQMGEDFPIEHGLVSKTIERAQTSVEGYNFDIRKHLLEYDDVLNRQRDSIYAERLRILKTDDVRPEVWRMFEAQVDEYMEKIREEPGQVRVLFAGLDDVVPFTLPSPTAPFQGPLSFGGHLTAFPTFTIGFLADQLADQPVERAQQELHELPRRAAAVFGSQVREGVAETARATTDKYDERLERVRAVLDEKIDDYRQLVEERNEPLDPRRLAQHLERTYPIKLSTPQELLSAGSDSLDELREHWLQQVDVEFHRQTCIAFMDRAQGRLPGEALGGMERVRPSLLAPEKLADELKRVRELALSQSLGEEGRRALEGVVVREDAGPNEVWEFLETVKENSELDRARLDRLVGHVLGAELDALLEKYQEATDSDQVRLRRDMERVRDSVVEDKKGGRTNLTGLLRQLNDWAHLEIDDLESLVGKAVAHEFDKWAQRQILEIDADAARSPVADASWNSIAQHLLSTYYTQKQVFDREHRRQTTWTSRLPFGFVAEASVQEMEPDELRQAILNSLHWALDLREATWGAQELHRWRQLSLENLDEASYDGLLRFLGDRELGEHKDDRVDDLPPDLYEHVRFVLAIRQMCEVPLGSFPQAGELLARLGKALETQLLETPVGQLDRALQDRIAVLLQQLGLLDDATARDRLLNQPIGEWDRRTQDEMAGFWGRAYVEAHQAQTLADLETEARDAALATLQRQRRFVDEERVQRFLVHERLADLPEPVRSTALRYLAQSRVDRLSRRKISSLDVNSRQQVLHSLQRTGMFTDEARREELTSRSLKELEPRIEAGFAGFLAQRLLEGGRTLSELGETACNQVLERLRRSDLLVDPARLQAVPRQKLSEVSGRLANQLRDELVAQLRADLESKTMADLPETTREEVRRALAQQGYFVDQEKVNWYERSTLAQLPLEVSRGLETYLGQIRLGELAKTLFHDLPPREQDLVLGILDSEGLLVERAERLRLTQVGTLGELTSREQKALAQQLGRKWLVQIRERRPIALSERDRSLVWNFLRDQGYFLDEFKDELFALQRLDEFDAETQRLVRESLERSLLETLESRPVGELPEELQSRVWDRLRESELWVQPERLAQVEGTPAMGLPAEVRQAVETTVGELVLTDPSVLPASAGIHPTTQSPTLPRGQALRGNDGLPAQPVGRWPARLQDWLWQYLDEIGYFLDEKKRTLVLDRRLADLSSEVVEGVLDDMMAHLKDETVDKPVSELDADLRQGLREAVEAQGYFESPEERERLLKQPLATLPRTDLEALAAELGRVRLAALSARRLADLPEPEREEVLGHLQALQWFLDRARLEEVKAQRLGDLPGSVREQVLGVLRQEQLERLRSTRLDRLDRQQRVLADEVLRELGLGLEESQMRSFRGKKVSELEEEAYDDLLRDLGGQAVADWDATPFQDMDEDGQALVRAYLGRRIMGLIERRVLLYTISRLWIDYLTDIEDLRRGIGLEAFGQRDPLVEYKRKAFELFEDLANNIRRDVVRTLFRQPPEPLRA